MYVSPFVRFTCYNLTGPSGLHQRYFDEAVQDGKRIDDSPTMRQHDEDDDDSSSKYWALLCLHHSNVMSRNSVGMTKK